MCPLISNVFCVLIFINSNIKEKIYKWTLITNPNLCHTDGLHSWMFELLLLTKKKKKIWLTTSAPVWNIEGWRECFTAYSKMYECSCCGPKSQNPVYQQEMHKSDAEKSSEEVLIQWVTSPAESEREIVKDVVLAQLLLLVLLLWPCKPILSMDNL